MPLFIQRSLPGDRSGVRPKTLSSNINSGQWETSEEDKDMVATQLPLKYALPTLPQLGRKFFPSWSDWSQGLMSGGQCSTPTALTDKLCSPKGTTLFKLHPLGPAPPWRRCCGAPGCLLAHYQLSSLSAPGMLCRKSMQLKGNSPDLKASNEALVSIKPCHVTRDCFICLNPPGSPLTGSWLIKSASWAFRGSRDNEEATKASMFRYLVRLHYGKLHAFRDHLPLSPPPSFVYGFCTEERSNQIPSSTKENQTQNHPANCQMLEKLPFITKRWLTSMKITSFSPNLLSIHIDGFLQTKKRNQEPEAE